MNKTNKTLCFLYHLMTPPPCISWSHEHMLPFLCSSLCTLDATRYFSMTNYFLHIFIVLLYSSFNWHTHTTTLLQTPVSRAIPKTMNSLWLYCNRLTPTQQKDLIDISNSYMQLKSLLLKPECLESLQNWNFLNNFLLSTPQTTATPN